MPAASPRCWCCPEPLPLARRALLLLLLLLLLLTCHATPLSPQAGRDVERLADQLMAVNENAFVHGSSSGALYGGRPNTDDWTIAAGTAGSGAAGAAPPARPADDGTGLDAGGEEGEAPEAGSLPLEVDVAPAGRLPFQEASLQVRGFGAMLGLGYVAAARELGCKGLHIAGRHAARPIPASLLTSFSFPGRLAGALRG